MGLIFIFEVAKLSMRVNFYTKNGWLFLRCYPRRKSICEFYLNEYIPDQHWSNHLQRPKSTYKHYTTLVNLIQRIKDAAINAVIDSKAKGIYLSGPQLKAVLERELYGVETSSAVAEYFAKWIEYKRHSLKSGTIRAIKSKLRPILDQWPDLTFEMMDARWRRESEMVLRDRYSHNSISKTYKLLGQIASDALHEGVHTNDVLSIKGWHIPERTAQNIYLSIEDLKALYRYPFEPMYQNAVSLFLIGCFTGQRVSDFKRIDDRMTYSVKDMQYIRLKQVKTGQSVTIPMHPILSDLLKRDHHMISDQKLNDYIKEACRMAGIEQWEKVKTSTARRSFATNMVLAGVPMDMVMTMTGHKTEKSFRTYIKYDDVIIGKTIIKNEGYQQYIKSLSL